MIALIFKGKPRRTGTSISVTIPMGLANVLDKKKEYWFRITEERGENDGLL
jgi:hypothetical protein